MSINHRMPNPQLSEYVKTQLAKGIHPDMIKKAVLTAGWSTKDADAVFLQLNPSSSINTSPIQSISMHLEQGIMPQTPILFPSDRLASPSELLTFAWHVFAKRWKTLIGIQLLSFLMLIVPIAVMLGAILTSVIDGTKTTRFDSPANILNITVQPSPIIQPPIPSFSPVIIVIIIVIFIITMIPAMLVQLWGQLAMIYAIKGRGEELGIKSSFGRARRKILPLLGVTILMSASVMTGYILLFIPGLIFALWFFLSPYALVYEDSDVLGALLTSRSFTRNHKLAVFGRLLVLSACLFIPLTIMSVLIGIGSAVHKNIGILVNLITAIILQLTVPAFVMAYSAGIYESLKAVKGHLSIVVTTKAKVFFIITAFIGMVFFALMLIAPLIISGINPSSQFAKARDASRTIDIRSIQNALNREFVIKGAYPASLDELVPVQMSKIPTDPQTYKPYEYQVRSSGQDYELCVTFESTGRICERASGTQSTVPQIIY